MLKELIKIANELDKRGLAKEADALDSIVKTSAAVMRGFTDEEKALLEEHGETAGQGGELPSFQGIDLSGMADVLSEIILGVVGMDVILDAVDFIRGLKSSPRNAKLMGAAMAGLLPVVGPGLKKVLKRSSGLDYLDDFEEAVDASMASKGARAKYDELIATTSAGEAASEAGQASARRQTGSEAGQAASNPYPLNERQIPDNLPVGERKQALIARWSNEPELWTSSTHADFYHMYMGPQGQPRDIAVQIARMQSSPTYRGFKRSDFRDIYNAVNQRIGRSNPSMNPNWRMENIHEK